MNLSDTVGFEGLDDLDVGTPEGMKQFALELTRRLESYRLNQINQLNAQPTVFYADPDADPDAVSGTKPGDVAVWVDSLGVSQFRVFT